MGAFIGERETPPEREYQRVTITGEEQCGVSIQSECGDYSNYHTAMLHYT